MELLDIALIEAQRKVLPFRINANNTVATATAVVAAAETEHNQLFEATNILFCACL